MLYTVNSKYKPNIFDTGSEYRQKAYCTKCGLQNELVKTGAFFPTWQKRIGLFLSIGGIVGSTEAIQYLSKNGVDNFSKESINIAFAKFSNDQKFFLLKPKRIIELDVSKGAGPIIVCQECKRRLWGNSLLLPYLKNADVSHVLFQIKFTYIFIVNELFIQAAKNVPDGNYLDFEQWQYSLEGSNGTPC